MALRKTYIVNKLSVFSFQIFLTMTESKYTCRRSINLIVLTGFFIFHMLHSIFPIALVDMIPIKTKTTDEKLVFSAKTNESTSESTIIRFNWTQTQKHSLIGIYMWGQVISEFPFGRLTEMYGPRRVIGFSVLIHSILAILLPFAFQLHYNFAWFYRFMMGLFGVPLRVSVEIIAIRWFPPSDLSKFMGKTLMGSLGEAFALLCAGYIISFLGWPSLFYICGSISLVWSLIWFYNIYDTPQEHPRISVNEKLDIMNALNKELKYLGRPKKLPFKEMFTNKRVLALFATFVFGGFSFMTFLNYIPTFITNVLHFNIRENGLLSSLHYIGSFTFGTASCYIANFLIKSKKISVTRVRKLLTGTGQCASGLLILSLILWGNSRNYCVIVFIASFSVKSLILGGHAINAIDLAPNFAATISSVCFIIATLSGWLSTKVISATVSVDNTFESWRLMFIILAISSMLSGLTFVLFGSGELQAFNNREERKKVENVEQLKNLKEDNV